MMNDYLGTLLLLGLGVVVTYYQTQLYKEDQMTWWQRFFLREEEPEESLVDKMQIDTLKEKGFHYNEEEDQWERVWVVATRDGAERSKEVYKKEGDNWRVIMYGNTGEVFFEHPVNENND